MDSSFLAMAEEEEDSQLQALVKQGFPSTRATEARMGAYLELNDLLRVEDTEASVRQLQRCVPMLLREFRHDLQEATEPDLLHVCLRTLSYFMYHQSLSVVFTDAQVSAFLSDILTRLCATQDEVNMLPVVLPCRLYPLSISVCSRPTSCVSGASPCRILASRG